jgi:hypothetical protein
MYKSSKKICLICLISSNKKMPVKNMKEYTQFTTNCNCNALFHNDCLTTWFNKSLSCPICLKPILKNATTNICINYNHNNNNIRFINSIRHICNIIHFSLFCFIILLSGYIVIIFDKLNNKHVEYFI